MKTFSFVLIFTFLIGYKKEKSFADDIVLTFPKDEKLTFQEFNDDLTMQNQKNSKCLLIKIL